MTPRTASPLAGIRWLKDGLNSGRDNPKAQFGAAALLVLLGLLPSVLTYPLQSAAEEDLKVLILSVAISILAGVLMVPLVCAYLRIVHHTETGQRARALDLFEPFRRGGGAGRMILFGLLLMGLYVALFALAVVVAGQGVIEWVQQIEAARAASRPNSVQAMPNGLGLLIILLFVVFLFMAGVYALGLGQVAIANRSPMAALRDGMAGSVRNVVPIFLLLVIATVAGLMGALVFGLLVGLVALVGALIAPWLALVLVAPFYLGLMLALYVVMMGTMYALWRDVYGQDASTTAVAG